MVSQHVLLWLIGKINWNAGNEFGIVVLGLAHEVTVGGCQKPSAEMYLGFCVSGSNSVKAKVF